MNTNEQRVRRGARLLDQELPGWRSRVNSDSLDMGSSRRCVLGQCYGSYGSGIVSLGLTGSRLSRMSYGFRLREKHTWEDYELWQATWRKIIQEDS